MSAFLHSAAGAVFLFGLACIFTICAIRCALEASCFHPDDRLPWSALFWVFVTLAVGSVGFLLCA